MPLGLTVAELTAILHRQERHVRVILACDGKSREVGGLDVIRDCDGKPIAVALVAACADTDECKH